MSANNVVNLTKGARVDLTKAAPGTIRFGFGLGWDSQKFQGAAFDCDASVCFTKDGKAASADDILFYGTPGFDQKAGIKDFRGFATHTGDNLTGAGDGDDETIIIDVTKVDINAVNDIQFNVAIYDAKNRNQSFGMIDNAFIRVYDADTNVEICRYDLTEDFFDATAVQVGKLYNKGDGWKFQAVGGGFPDGLTSILAGIGLGTTGG